MKSQVRAMAVVVGLFCAASSFAQAPVPSAKVSAPASPAAVAAPVAAPAAKAPVTSEPAAKTTKTTAPAAVAPGGGDGKVWVNTKSKVFHCEGTQPYGTTKSGEYMTEADAKAKGNHGVNGKSCSK